MKTLKLFCLPVLLLFLVACDKEEEIYTNGEAAITEINFSTTSNVGEGQEILVTIHKGTPCHYIKEIKTTSSGKTINYDFILSNEGTEFCIQVVAHETVPVNYEPTETGEYTLNFYINGDFHQSRSVTVTE